MTQTKFSLRMWTLRHKSISFRMIIPHSIHQQQIRCLSPTNLSEPQPSRVNSMVIFLKSLSFLDLLGSLFIPMRRNMHFTVSYQGSLTWYSAWLRVVWFGGRARVGCGACAAVPWLHNKRHITSQMLRKVHYHGLYLRASLCFNEKLQCVLIEILRHEFSQLH